MKNKAFTLVELLAVIVILAIILIVAVPAISNVIEVAKKSTLDSQVKFLHRAALTKYEEDPSYAFDALNKSNLKQELGMDGTSFDAIGVELNGEKITATIVKEGLSATTSNDTAVNDAKVYGLYWDGNNTFTRTDDASTLKTVNVGVGGTPVVNNFDTAEIYSEMTEVTDALGNQFIKIPRFFIKKTVTGDAWTWQISKTNKDGEYYLPACFVDETTGKIFPYILVGKYDASLSVDNKLESKTSKAPLVSKTITQFRDYAKANGAGYQIIDIHVVDVLQTLFYIEFATLDSQTKMYGYTNANSSALSSGETDIVVAKSGSMDSNSDGKHAMKYRGIENLWGNVWQFVDGINIKADNQAYVSRNADTYLSDKYDGDYIRLGYSNSNANGSVLKMGYDSNNPYVQFAVSVGSGKYGDYYYQATGNRIALFGGGWSTGASAGVSRWNLNYASSKTNPDLGSRLLKTPF